MKSRFLHHPIFFFALLALFYSCSNDRSKNSIEEKIHEPDNEVISQTVQSIIDSLDNLIKINLKEDYLKYKIIYIGDSLFDFGVDSALFKKVGINIDSMKCNKKGGTKLEILNKSLKGGKELRLVSSYKEYEELKQQNFANRILMGFSQVYFDKKYDEGFFNFWFSCSFNAGIEYAVYVKKENGKWIVKKIFVSGIR